MSTNQRLTKLEDAAGALGGCSHISVAYSYEGDESVPDDPICAACDAPFGTQIIVEYVEQPLNYESANA
jgi:hypothetical protein